MHNKQTKVTQETLEAAGCKQFTSSVWRYTNKGWQKCFYDTAGRKYFITAAEYDNSAYPDIIEFKGRYSFAPETQFKIEATTFDIQMHSPDSIEQMERFFEDVWNMMNCDYYEKY